MDCIVSRQEDTSKQRVEVEAYLGMHRAPFCGMRMYK